MLSTLFLPWNCSFTECEVQLLLCQCGATLLLHMFPLLLGSAGSSGLFLVMLEGAVPALLMRNAISHSLTRTNNCASASVIEVAGEGSRNGLKMSMRGSGRAQGRAVALTIYWGSFISDHPKAGTLLSLSSVWNLLFPSDGSCLLFHHSSSVPAAVLAVLTLCCPQLSPQPLLHWPWVALGVDEVNTSWEFSTNWVPGHELLHQLHLEDLSNWLRK